MNLTLNLTSSVKLGKKKTSVQTHFNPSFLTSDALHLKTQEKKRLVVIQCDFSQTTGELIACARYRICDLRAKVAEELMTHVLFVIHLPRNLVNSSFVGFQGEPWISYHVDDLRPPDDIAIPVGEAIGMTMCELFIGRPSRRIDEQMDDRISISSAMSDNHGELSSLEPAEEIERAISPLVEACCYGRLHGCIQAAASKLKDITRKRCTERVATLVNLIPKEPPRHGKIHFKNPANYCYSAF